MPPKRVAKGNSGYFCWGGQGGAEEYVKVFYGDGKNVLWRSRGCQVVLGGARWLGEVVSVVRMAKLGGCRECLHRTWWRLAVFRVRWRHWRASQSRAVVHCQYGPVTRGTVPVSASESQWGPVWSVRVTAVDHSGDGSGHCARILVSGCRAQGVGGDWRLGALDPVTSGKLHSPSS